MKYKLINKTTLEEHLCDKVVIDGWDYYVSDESPLGDEYVFEVNRVKFICSEDESTILDKKIIATSNPNIDIPKVVDEVKMFAESQYPTTIDSFNDKGCDEAESKRIAYEAGYNKSQETHPNSDDDMIEFAIWLNDTDKIIKQTKHIDFSKSDKEVAKELFQIWKEQRTKTLYYE